MQNKVASRVMPVKWMVEGAGFDGFWRESAHSIHLPEAIQPRVDGWCGFGWYRAAPPHRPLWQRFDHPLEEHVVRETVTGGREFEQRPEARRGR
jgi:hypothetical protein